jgi:hypothetical protein
MREDSSKQAPNEQQRLRTMNMDLRGNHVHYGTC